MDIREEILQLQVQKGVRKATYERNTSFVENLLRENVFDYEKIAELANVSVDFVELVKKRKLPT